jgi:hypothetical protein
LDRRRDFPQTARRFLRWCFCGLKLSRWALARKNHAKAEATSSLRALKQTLRACLRARFKINESKQTVLKLFSPKAAEFSGVAGEFHCQSLHRSQISKDL